MSVNKVNSDGSLSRVAGGTLYADLAVGSIVPFGGSTAPSGWLLCQGQAISRTEYSELFAVIGTAYGTGDGSTTFNLPDLRDRFVEGASDTNAAGTSIAAGLPNITGASMPGRVTSGNNAPATGAIRQNLDGAKGLFSTDDSSSYVVGGQIIFNASLSNSIYGKSTTVQPPALCLNYIIKAKMTAIPADFLAKVDEAVEDVYGDIIPSDASVSNKLVAHQTPYESFTLNNNSGSQKWYKLGTYISGNNTARLDFVSARVDGQMFESSVRISGLGADANYISWIGENGSEASIFAIKVDTNRNLYVQMNSYSAIEIRVYGAFTLNITEQSSAPSGAGIPLQKLVTGSDISYLSSDKLMYHQETGAAVLYLAAYHWQLPVNTTYLVHITASDKNSPGDNYDGIVKFTYGGTSSTITNISYYKLSGTGTIDAVNNSGTIQFSFSNGLPEICVAFMG